VQYRATSFTELQNALSSANPVNDEDTQARTTPDPAPILTAAKLDRTTRFPACPRHAP
jgi:hypothetical protein